MPGTGCKKAEFLIVKDKRPGGGFRPDGHLVTIIPDKPLGLHIVFSPRPGGVSHSKNDINCGRNSLRFSGFKVTATTQRDSSGDKNDS